MNQELFVFESLVEKKVLNTIGSLSVGDKNLELRFIVVKKIASPLQRGGGVYQRYLVADYSGSIFCDFAGDFIKVVREGDVIYATNFIAILNRNQLILYQGKLSTAFIIGRFFLEFSVFPNMSESDSI